MHLWLRFRMIVASLIFLVGGFFGLIARFFLRIGEDFIRLGEYIIIPHAVFEDDEE